MSPLRENIVTVLINTINTMQYIWCPSYNRVSEIKDIHKGGGRGARLVASVIWQLTKV